MKRKILVKKLLESGCVLIRHGGNHDIFQNPQTGLKQSVPRHNEIDENLCRHILKYLTK
jgi:predicted RNA binding protein YcfA (HicA-like mRNA interferase family)